MEIVKAIFWGTAVTVLISLFVFFMFTILMKFGLAIYSVVAVTLAIIYFSCMIYTIRKR